MRRHPSDDVVLSTAVRKPATINGQPDSCDERRRVAGEEHNRLRDSPGDGAQPDSATVVRDGLTGVSAFHRGNTRQASCNWTEHLR